MYTKRIPDISINFKEKTIQIPDISIDLNKYTTFKKTIDFPKVNLSYVNTSEPTAAMDHSEPDEKKILSEHLNEFKDVQYRLLFRSYIIHLTKNTKSALYLDMGKFGLEECEFIEFQGVIENTPNILNFAYLATTVSMFPSTHSMLIQLIDHLEERVSSIPFQFELIDYLNENKCTTDFIDVARKLIFSEYYKLIQEPESEPKRTTFENRKEWRNAKGQLHRIDGPAIEWANGNESWYYNDKRHRTDGPAVITNHGNTKQWFINGIEYTQDYEKLK